MPIRTVNWIIQTDNGFIQHLNFPLSIKFHSLSSIKSGWYCRSYISFLFTLFRNKKNDLFINIESPSANPLSVLTRLEKKIRWKASYEEKKNQNLFRLHKNKLQKYIWWHCSSEIDHCYFACAGAQHLRVQSVTAKMSKLCRVNFTNILQAAFVLNILEAFFGANAPKNVSPLKWLKAEFQRKCLWNTTAPLLQGAKCLGQFHQCSTSNFYPRRYQKRNKAA